MGFLDPSFADDIDTFASELLRREDPEPLEIFQRMAFGSSDSRDDGPEVYVNGMRM